MELYLGMKKIICTTKNKMNKVAEKIKEVDELLAKLIEGDKEIWEYEKVSGVARKAVRIMALMLPVIFYIGLLWIFYISLTGERIEGLGIVTAAIIAGCFTMLSSIGNTEANIRSLRSSWIEESRKDLAKYIGNARRYLVAAEKCRIKRIELKDREEQNKSIGHGIKYGGEKEINEEISKRKSEALDAQMNFFESYAVINVKYRSIAKGEEKAVYQALVDHYDEYRSVCGLLYSDRSAYQDIDKSRCYELDTFIGDTFGNYFVEEWKRAKKGDKELVTKKNMIILTLAFFVLAYSYNVINSSVSSSNEETIVNESKR